LTSSQVCEHYIFSEACCEHPAVAAERNTSATVQRRDDPVGLERRLCGSLARHVCFLCCDGRRETAMILEKKLCDRSGSDLTVVMAGLKTTSQTNKHHLPFHSSLLYIYPVLEYSGEGLDQR